MVNVVAVNYIKKDKVDEVIKIAEELVNETRKEKGCLKYILCQDSKDETMLTVIEEWETMEDLVAHSKSEHFMRIVPQIAELSEKEGMTNFYKTVY